jgi:L-alanine-DL-glutamate epimerase-like enolase superfamily enzyme
MSSVKIKAVIIRRMRIPLKVPYVLSYKTFEEFEPIVCEVVLSNGNTGWGEGHISPGSSRETRYDGWQFINEIASSLIGCAPEQAIFKVLNAAKNLPVAKTSITTAIEMAVRSETLLAHGSILFPLLTPFSAYEPDAIIKEVEEHIKAGFKTFKIKVGKCVEFDLSRLRDIQSAIRGRASLRLDANRAYTLEQALDFVKRLDPHQIELFEQPCDASDWSANATVAEISTVPIMLDEPICTLADIERAGHLKNVEYCKLKLKRFGSISHLEEGIDRVSHCGMKAVLGDGLGGDLSCWMETCIANGRVHVAGEFNGFLKQCFSLLSNPIEFRKGNVVIPKNYWPDLDRETLDNFTIEEQRFLA